MSRRLTDLCAEQAKCCATAGHGGVPCMARESVDHKRPSAWAPWVFVSTTSAHSCGGRWSQRGVLFETVGVSASLGRELGRRSIIAKEDKGVMET